MMYTSTRDNSVKVTAAQAIANGISKDGGLFVPTEIPTLTLDELNELVGMDYQGRAVKVLGKYLSDFTAQELTDCVSGAYGGGKFSSDKTAPVVKLDESAYIQELWHGPTCAFKDMALQILPHLLTRAAGKTVGDKQIVILVATSGDTGKAALEGFKDVPNTKILVFYPSDGVSVMQKLQMVTQEGGNVGVCAIKGNFDDAQSGVKAIFTSPDVAKLLEDNGMQFSSANSINWGRLAPQIVYYISAYCDLVEQGAIKLGDKINVAVPTGNFGNILAAYYAKEMGLPVGKLICASNANNVLTDFLSNGTYDRNRNFFTTISPSMDILISSNLERLLYILSGGDDKKVSGYMSELSKNGKYTVDADILEKIKAVFSAGCCDDEQTKATIGSVYADKKYLCDTHTAVAVKVYDEYRKAAGDSTPTVIASTASPFKFTASVLSAINPALVEGEEYEMAKVLEDETGVPCPAQLTGLENKEIRFSSVIDKTEMYGAVYNMLGIEG
ncbi:MAG: threonine synthase [Clostridia bacterium]|nr:threonine synthase [Clostridia bacterium]